MNNRDKGSIYEQMAATYMVEQGMQILEMNYRCKQGEIDIIAKDQDYLVFTEVKYRKNLKNGYPSEAVTVAKQRKIYQVASYYLYAHRYSEATKIRFDVASILDKDITYIKNAFN